MYYGPLVRIGWYWPDRTPRSGPVTLTCRRANPPPVRPEAARADRRQFLKLATGVAAGGSLAAGCTEPAGDRGSSPVTGTEKPNDGTTWSPSFAGGDGWSMAGHDAGNTGFEPAASDLADDPSVEWASNVRGVYTLASPAVADGSLFIGSKHSIYAIDAATGEREWTTEPGATGSDRWADVRGELTHAFTPAATGSILVVGARSLDGLDGGPDPGLLVGLAPDTGDHLWSAGTHVSTSPTVGERDVFVGTTAADRTAVEAFDAENGELRWSRSVGAGADLRLLGAPAVANDVVYATPFDREREETTIVALDASTGSERWERTFSGRARVRPVVVGGLAFVVTDDGTVRAFVAGSGDQRWTVSLDGEVNAAPAVNTDSLFVLSTAAFEALDPSTGQRRWHRPQDDPRVTDLAATDESLYAGGYTLVSLAANDGTVRYTRRLGENGGAFGAPAVAGDALYVGACIKTDENRIYDNDVRALA